MLAGDAWLIRTFFLTFDTEDFISENSVPGLHAILELLKKHELTALFFITGHMAEKLSTFPTTVDLLSEHQIGFHSSSHSVHPTLFEFTDVESYEEAYQTALIRESSHINPLTGEIEGSGGIHALQALFTKKQIVAFRSPGYCWTPPHLDAMKKLGMFYDFSTNISPDPFNHNGITFYPFTVLTSWNGGFREQSRLQRLILKLDTTVLTIHPSTMVNRLDWDLIYYHKNNQVAINPTTLTQPLGMSPKEAISKYRKFELLLRHLATLKRLHLLKITPEPEKSDRDLNLTSADVLECYMESIKWAQGFGYTPKYLYNHFARFFNVG